LASAIPLLKEIQQYVSQGWQPVTATTPTQSQELASLAPAEPSFELCAMLGNGTAEVLCPTATLDSNWSKSGRPRPPGHSEAHGKLFKCGCQSPSLQHANRLDSLSRQSPSPHPLKNPLTDLLSVTPLSFVIRLADQELSWMLYKIADRDNGSQISLVIRKLSPKRQLALCPNNNKTSSLTLNHQTLWILKSFSFKFCRPFGRGPGSVREWARPWHSSPMALMEGRKC
jgi:hypothetical protein